MKHQLLCDDSLAIDLSLWEHKVTDLVTPDVHEDASVAEKTL